MTTPHYQQIGVDQFNFRQSPGGSLAIGSNTVALPLMPPGLAVGNYLHIENGTGAAEAVPITAVGTNTVTVTCANTHSGAWSITSASGGLQEAVQALRTGRFRLPDSGITIYQKVTLPAGRYTIDGGNGATAAYSITRATSYPNGDLFYISQSALVSVEFCNMGISNDTGGAQVSGGCFHVYAADYSVIFDSVRFTNMWVNGGVIGWILQAAGSIKCYNVSYYGTANTVNCLNQTPDSGTVAGGAIVWSGGFINGPNLTGDAFNIGMVDGLWIIGCDIFGWANAIVLVPANTAGTYLGSVNITGNRIDGPKGYGIIIENTHSKFLRYINIVCNNIDAGAGNTGWGIDVCGTGGGSDIVIQGLNIQANNISGYNGYGIAVGAVQAAAAINILGNNVIDCQAAGPGSYINLAGSKGIKVSANTCAGTNCSYGLSTSGAAVTGSIIGNDFRGASVSPFNFNVSMANCVVANNGGVDDIIPTVASGTTITAPNNPAFYVTGTTTITTITVTNSGWIGRRIRIVKTDAGSVTIGGGGNIPGTHTLAQNGGMDLVFDGSNWY